MYVSDINTLINLPAPIASGDYILGGYFSEGDGGGGTFIWISTPIISGDGGILFQNVNDPNGHFKRIYSGPNNVRWFGAKGDSVTDDTAAVHAARNSSFTRDGTIYFPESRNSAGTITAYVGAFNMLNYNINILGDGVGSVLKAKDTGTDPVLILGNQTGAFWLFSRVEKIKIDGTSANGKHDGVVFNDTNSAEPELAGRWIFQNVTFSRCGKGVYKPFGNIGNTYENCTWEYNDFGYYAEDFSTPGPPPRVMHSGCDRFLGGHIAESSKCGIFIKGAVDFGQVIIDGTIIEGNPGFGIFIRLSSVARLTGNGIDFRNVWMEANATSQVGIVIDGTPFLPTSIRDYYFEDVRSVSITNSNVNKIKLKKSCVNLWNCRSDNAGAPNIVEVDAESSFVSYEHRNNFQVSENIFVQSLSYDGTGDVGNAVWQPTSVWGPLRTTLIAGLDNLLLASNPQDNFVSEIWPGYAGSPDGYASDVSGAGTMINFADINAAPGNLTQIVCKEMTLSNGQVVSNNNPGFIPVTDVYYFWSIHTYLCSGRLTGWIGAAPNANEMLGQVIFKDREWACSFGIKKFSPTAAPTQAFNIWFEGAASPLTSFRFCHYQVLAFPTLSAAISYANSKGIASYGETCGEIGGM